MHIEREALETALMGLPAQSGVAPDLQSALRSVIEAARPLLRAAGSGLLVLDDAQVLRYAGSTDEDARRLELGQIEAEEGPCVDSVIYDTDVATPDVQHDERWPRLAEQLAGSPIRAVLGLPVHVGGAAVGSFNVYADRRYEWDESDLLALRAFGQIVEQLLGTAMLAHQHGALVGQLQRALESRVPIERAVGLLMGRHDCDAVTAFNRLRHQARSQRRRVVDVANELLDAQRLQVAGGDVHGPAD